MLKKLKKASHVAEPWRTFVVMLTVIFVTEASIMLLLPKFLPADVDWLMESMLDALVLTMVCAHVFWGLLVRPLRRLAEFRAELLAQILAAQEAERRRIARDLHDEVGQTLTSLLIGLRTVTETDTVDAARTRVDELREVTSTLLEDIKRLARGLRPSVLDDLGLAPALERLTLDFGRVHDVEVSLDMSGLMESRLAEAVEVTVYRIVQESLTNTVKHAGAHAARVSIARTGNELVVAIQDNGCGFTTMSSQKLMSDGHLGLAGMSERAALLGGSFVVESKPGDGTVVRARLPLEIFTGTQREVT
ncbi:MAG TPA: sensor histidine kinase [Planctomycetaceae bacterium]|nr:sensor histidine kinase [Planctomycetaceae bacterium]